MDCTIRKGLTGLLAGSMLFLSGFARAGEAADENRGYPATQDATEIPAVQAGGNSAASGFDTSSETDGNTRTDSTAAFPRRRFVHGIGLELRPEYVCPTNPFLAGDNLARQPIDLSLAAHLRYSFRFQPGSRPDRIYGGAYQGVGFSYYSFENREELGTPVAFYIFQGARIARISRRLSFNYEWNFGLSFGWKPYDTQMNPANIMMGSKINAYINADFYLNVTLTRELDFSAGLSMTHFSNGNTKFPNAGLNSIGMKFGLLYCFGRADDPLVKPRRPLLAPDFPRHFSYDLVLFGSWRRKGVEVGDKQYASPNAYGVAGFNFATMYNFATNSARVSRWTASTTAAPTSTPKIISSRSEAAIPATRSTPRRSTGRSHWEYRDAPNSSCPTSRSASDWESTSCTRAATSSRSIRC